MPPKAPATPEERAARMAAKGFPGWARDYIKEREAYVLQLEDLTRKLGAALQEAQASRPFYAADVQGDAVEGATIRFGGQFAVRYGAHDTTAGAHVLVVEADRPLIIRPYAQNEIIIAKG